MTDTSHEPSLWYTDFRRAQPLVRAGHIRPTQARFSNGNGVLGTTKDNETENVKAYLEIHVDNFLEPLLFLWLFKSTLVGCKRNSG